ncbi:GAF and ANTAR domain-containing protein [Pseudonocardia xishanensis]|uniref:GAF and ANTAR domain-containing protein n=1 Tax=Pseudonocardia xishanensis TaxID=630995 RepID=A0ABP8S070_9PSEU
MVERSDTVANEDVVEAAYRGAERLARTLHARSNSVEDLVTAVCEQAVDLVEPAQGAGVIIAAPRRHLTTVAAIGVGPAELDALQQDTGEGPCLTAAQDQVVVRVRDTATEDRWPSYAEAARTLGVGSMLCLPLEAGDRTLGTLSLYAAEAEAFAEGAAGEPAVRLLAALAATTLAQTRLVDQLREALANRDLIGQAKGIVMARYSLDAEQAFALIRRYSQDHNVKLADLAGALSTRLDFPT